MGRAQAAHWCSRSCSCRPNRFADRDVFNDGGTSGGICAHAVGNGCVLPAPERSVAPSGDACDFQETDQQVALLGIWYHLPEEERIRFGGCFSRMILKMINPCYKREDGA